MSFIGTINIPPDGTIHQYGSYHDLTGDQDRRGRHLGSNRQRPNEEPHARYVDRCWNRGHCGHHRYGVCFASGNVDRAPLRIRSPSCSEGRVRAQAPVLGMSLFIERPFALRGLFCGLVGDFPVDITGNQPRPARARRFTIFPGEPQHARSRQCRWHAAGFDSLSDIARKPDDRNGLLDGELRCLAPTTFRNPARSRSWFRVRSRSRAYRAAAGRTGGHPSRRARARRTEASLAALSLVLSIALLLGAVACRRDAPDPLEAARQSLSDAFSRHDVTALSDALASCAP